MTPYETLIEEGFIHHVSLNGNRRELQRRIRNVVQQAEQRLEERILSSASRLSEADINRIRRGTFRGTQRLEELSTRLDDFTTQVSDALRTELIDAARDLAMYEAMFWQDRYASLVEEDETFAPLVNTDQRLTRTARSNVTRAVLITGTVAAAIAAYRRSRRERIRSRIVMASQANGLQAIMELLTVSSGARQRGRLLAGETTRTINTFTGDVHTHAAAIGAQAFAESNDAFDLVWTSIIDELTSSICLTRNGQFVNRDLGGLLPPAHFNCLDGDSLVASRSPVSGASERWYDGKIITIKTALGNELTVTPNHPVLTNSGWIAAGEINEIDYIIGCRGGDFAATNKIDNKDDVTSISDKFKSVERSLGVSAVVVPSSAPDFHGDGADGEVNIVNANGGLSSDVLNAAHDKKLEQLVLVSAYLAGAGFPRFGSLAHFFESALSAPRSDVSRFDELFSLLWSASVHSRMLLLAGISYMDALAKECSGKFLETNIEFSAYCAESDARRVFFHSVFDLKISHWGVSGVESLNPSSFKMAMNAGSAESSDFSYFVDRFVDIVQFNKVVDVSVKDFAGHVYNLENEDGFYIAQNLIVHNCRSIALPLPLAERASQTQLNRLNPDTRRAIERGVPNFESTDASFNALSERQQVQLLGRTRFNLFQAGEISSVRDFIGNREELLTLDDLASREGIDLGEFR